MAAGRFDIMRGEKDGEVLAAWWLQLSSYSNRQLRLGILDSMSGDCCEFLNHSTPVLYTQHKYFPSLYRQNSFCQKIFSELCI